MKGDIMEIVKLHHILYKLIEEDEGKEYILLDLCSKDGGGVEKDVKTLREAYPDIPIHVVYDIKEKSEIERAIKLGFKFEGDSYAVVLTYKH